jgi:hypothetical protein
MNSHSPRLSFAEFTALAIATFLAISSCCLVQAKRPFGTPTPIPTPTATSTPSAAATTTYVNNINTCPGAGTSTDPYCTIQQALNVAIAGTDIRIENSSVAYNENDYTTSSGTSTQPIVIEADDPTNPPNWYYIGNGQTYVTGGSGTGAALHIANGNSYWIVRNLLFDGTGVWTGFAAIWAESNNVGIRILNNIFKHWGGTEIQQSTGCGGACNFIDAIDANGMIGGLIQGNVFDGVRGHSVDSNARGQALHIIRNEFKNLTCQYYSPDNSLQTIGVHLIIYDGTQATTNDVIRANTFHDFQPSSGSGSCSIRCSDDSCSYIENSAIWADVGPSYGTIEGNLIYNINQQNIDRTYQPGHGIHIEANTQGWLVKNNVIHDVGLSCIYHNPNAAGYNTITDSSYYYNNTCYNFGTFGLYIWSGHAVFENNIVYGGYNDPVDLEPAALSQGGVTLDYNNYNTGTAVKFNYGSSYYNFTDWQNHCNCDAHSVNADAQFVSSSPPYNFHLQPGSPAIDAGTTLSVVPVDYDGITRPQLLAYDIGAYEFHY